MLMIRRIQTRIAALVGIDATLLYSLLARGWQFLAGTLTLLLVVHFMQPDQQGFYYTFKSMLNLELFFEMGLTFVVMQKTSHYFAYLSWSTSNKICGEQEKLNELARFISKTGFWYSCAALGFVLLVMPAGFLLFHLKDAATINFGWKEPWVLIVIGTSINLWLAPYIAVIEGSGRVAEVYRFRLFQFICASAVSWIILAKGGGLWAPVANIWIMALAAFYWLVLKNSKFFLFVRQARFIKTPFVWMQEVWPLQWRIAVSWMAGYFISQIFVPLLFYYRGPVISGQMGASLTVVNMLCLISLTWINVRSPKMGQLVAKKQWQDLDTLFNKIFWQSLMVFLLGCLCINLILLNLHTISQRLLPLQQIDLLLMGAFCTSITGALALYLRAHKREPFMPLSVIGAILTTLGAWYGAIHSGSFGISLNMLLVSLLFGLPSSILLWRYCKRRWHQDPIKN